MPANLLRFRPRTAVAKMESRVDQKSLEQMKLDRRLIRRRGWITAKELERELQALPDVAHKVAPPETDDDDASAASDAPPNAG